MTITPNIFHRIGRTTTSLIVAGLAVAFGGRPATADGPTAAVASRIETLLRDLDAEHYDVRLGAQREIERLLDDPDRQAALARRFQRLLREPDVSFEVRYHVQRWLHRLPGPMAESTLPDADVSAEDLDRWIDRLDADDFAQRVAARDRIEWLLGQPALVGPILTRLDARLDAEETSDSTRHVLLDLCERLRPTWAKTDPAQWDLPKPTDEQIDALVTNLSRLSAHAATAADALDARQCIRRWRDLTMRDSQVPRLRAALEGRLDGQLDPVVRARLREFHHKTQPAMVAEFWEDRQHQAEQHLIVGVPSQTARAPRPSHFDRIDDRTAHCVSGSSLAPGDYPVGVAIPHPRSLGSFFRLVNLPTPRSRLLYREQVERDDARRLEDITRRTCERWLTEGRRLTQMELNMLPMLDPAEVSRFAGKYLLAVDDEPIDPDHRRPDPYNPGAELPRPDFSTPAGRPTHHGWTCFVLAREGTKEAIPGLLPAIEKNRLLEPTIGSPFRLDLVAALSIADRDPWSEVEPWLARMVGRDDLLVEHSSIDLPTSADQSPPPELGATAAAMLLNSYGKDPASFGLEPVEGKPTLGAMHVVGYYFTEKDARAAVLDWWRSRKAKSLSQTIRPAPVASGFVVASNEDFTNVAAPSPLLAQRTRPSVAPFCSPVSRSPGAVGDSRDPPGHGRAGGGGG
jgi:hypothetical protein